MPKMDIVETLEQAEQFGAYNLGDIDSYPDPAGYLLIMAGVDEAKVNGKMCVCDVQIGDKGGVEILRDNYGDPSHPNPDDWYHNMLGSINDNAYEDTDTPEEHKQMVIEAVASYFGR